MGHMAVGIMVNTSRIEITRKNIGGSSISLIGEVMDIGSILVLVQTGIMVIITIMLTRGMIGDICEMSSRKPSHQHLMEN